MTSQITTKILLLKTYELQVQLAVTLKPNLDEFAGNFKSHGSFWKNTPPLSAYLVVMNI